LEDVVSIRALDDGERLTWRNGDTTFIPWDDNPHHILADGSEPERADFERLDPDRLDELDGLTGYTWNIYHVPWLAGKSRLGPLSEIPDYFFRTIDLVKSQVGEEISIHGEVFSPFTHFMEALGYEQALMSLVADRAKSHALLDRFTKASVTWAAAQARHGVDAVLISSAFAGGSFISPKMYREFVAPYEQRVTRAVRAVGVPVYTHTCGKIGDRLELMIETGTQGLDTLDPPPLGNVDLAEAKRLIGDRLFIKGNMNSVELLAYRTNEEVIAEAFRCLHAGKPGGGYILSTACSVSPHVEPWKLELLVPLAESLAG
jgi:uroporphyrinogen decarboxylase